MSMTRSQDTGPPHSPHTRNVESEYQQWLNVHERIKNSPPQEGRDYVRNAKNLLPLLEAFAELNPIAKAVVSTFRVVVTYEFERQENDARVAILFVSQSEMMGTLLDTDKLLTRRKVRQDDDDNRGPLYSDSRLSVTLDAAAKEIKACGNSMDTYYKQKRFVKLWKSQEWKERLSGHTTNLYQFRTDIQQILSIQTASDVGVVLKKMDDLLSLLFTPKADWEKETMMKARQLGKSKNPEGSKDLISNNDNLKTLVATTKDPLMDFQPNAKEDGVTKSGITSAIPAQIEQLKQELHLSLEVLCDRNQESFELKLTHRQLQETIDNSAQYIVQSLSGPYDRLNNEDLRVLWKEMNWIFCVDDKLFTSALFEYYLDRLSTRQHKLKPMTAPEENNEVHRLSTENPEEMMQEHLTKVSFLSRMGVLNHVDAWTLEPIAMYGDRISSAIDCDKSGFIRISEANAFTAQMPTGWSLPQWCAYTALGDAYESRIYRMRIRNILDSMMEMQAKVLPLNRGLVALSTVPQIIPFFQLMAWEPMTSESDVPAELRLLVHEKIKQQDDVRRQDLAKFNWSLDDEGTLRLLYGKKALETYILQLSTLFLEYAYDVMQACCLVIIDAKEMSRILSSLRFLQGTCGSRVTSLLTQFEKEKKPSDYQDTFSGGIWYAILHGTNPDNWEAPFQLPFRPAYDVDVDFQTMMQDFRLSPLPDKEHLPYLKYKTWEDHIRSIPKDEIPNRIPNSWNGETEDGNVTNGENHGHDLRYDWSQIPFTSRFCDKCGKNPIREYLYACTICSAFDFCSECWQHPAEEHTFMSHNFSHPMLRFALHTVDVQRNELIVDAQDAIRQVQEALQFQELVDLCQWDLMPDSQTLVSMRPSFGDADGDKDTDKDKPEAKDEDGNDDEEGTYQDRGNNVDSGNHEEGGNYQDSSHDEVDHNYGVGDNKDRGNYGVGDNDAYAGRGNGGDGDMDNDNDENKNEKEEKEVKDSNSNSDSTRDKDNNEAGDDSDQVTRYRNDNTALKEARITSPFRCSHCKETIPLNATTPFYKCMKHSCGDYMLCDSCASKQIVNENPEDHQWWHAMLVLDGACILGVGDFELPEEPKEGQDINPIDGIPSIGDRISAVETKLDFTNSMLQALSSRMEDKFKEGGDEAPSDTQALERRIYQLEEKVDGMVMELKGFLSSVAQRLDVY